MTGAGGSGNRIGGRGSRNARLVSRIGTEAPPLTNPLARNFAPARHVRIGRIVADMASTRRVLGFLAMTSVALVVAHNLVFLLAYGAGFDEALAHTGHDGTWGTAVAVVVTAAFGLVGLGAWRLYRLGVVAGSLTTTEESLHPEPIVFARRLVGLWLRLAATTTLIFVVLENLEHQHAGLGLPGLSVLESAEYPHASFVIAAIALAVAFLVSLFRWRRDVLVARIAAARGPWFRARQAIKARQAIWVDRRRASIVARQFSGRAPPQFSTL
jgi:hypothetical protein